MFRPYSLLSVACLPAVFVTSPDYSDLRSHSTEYFDEDGNMKTLKELRAMCREQGISIDGPKEELIRRMLYSKEIMNEVDDGSNEKTPDADGV